MKGGVSHFKVSFAQVFTLSIVGRDSLIFLVLLTGLTILVNNLTLDAITILANWTIKPSITNSINKPHTIAIR